MLRSRREATRIPEEVLRAALKYVEEVRERYGDRLKLAILYGSYARGDYTPSSDVDLLIVAENIPKTYWDRWSLAYDIVENHPLDPHIYTPEEFKDMVKQGRMTALDALTEGIVIHAEPTYRQEVDDILKETLKQRVKYKNMWMPKHYLPKIRENTVAKS